MSQVDAVASRRTSNGADRHALLGSGGQAREDLPGELLGSAPGYALTARLAPRNGLVRVYLAQALLASGGEANARAALKQLRIAEPTEGGRTLLHRLKARAYAALGDLKRAELETAEAALRAGDLNLAIAKAKRLVKRFRKGSPGWLRANDILNTAKRLKRL